jgi:hypothetical protein
LGNTTVMGMAWFFVLRNIQSGRWTQFLNDPREVLVNEFLSLGFKMKVRVTNDAGSVTFLKGMWYNIHDLPRWGPLPSRILKMGKSMKDPRSLYGVSSIEEAAELYLSDVASSYRQFLPVPILRAFVQRYRSTVARPTRSARLSKYTTQTSGLLADHRFDDDSMSVICDRYNVTIDDIVRVEEMILTSKPFTFLHDPVFLKLAEVDYS